MLNRLLAILLLAALICSNFSRFFVCAGFEANQGYIARVLCENKARPWMHCNGHCYLMKKLKEATDKEKKQEREDQKNRHQEALPHTPFTLTFIAPLLPQCYAQARIPETVQRSSAVFQPPRVRA